MCPRNFYPRDSAAAPLILAISSAHFGAERLLTLASLSSLQTRALYSAASPFLAFRDEPFKLIASFCCLSMYGELPPRHRSTLSEFQKEEHRSATACSRDAHKRASR